MAHRFRQVTKGAIAATALATIVAVTLTNGQTTLAQGPVRRSIGAQAVNACLTVDYAGIAAKAMNITAADLRASLVVGETLQQIAQDNNIDPKTVTDALTTARNAEIDQAVKDGVITQDEATAMEAPLGNGGGAPPANNNNGNGGGRPTRQPGAGGANTLAPQFPDVSNINLLLQRAAGTPPAGNGGRGGFGGGGFGNTMFNLVRPYEVVAQAVSMKCSDLVKDLITPPGKSAEMVANEQKVDPKTVTDALTKAYKDALAQDVTDGIITQAQADTLTPLIDPAVSTFVGNSLPMGPQVTATPSQ